MNGPNFYGVQRKTIDFGIDSKYAIYALEQGLGKSLCALATAIETKSRLLLVCPSYAIYKLRNEAKKFYPEAVVTLIENHKQIYRLFDTDIAILPYYYLPKADILFEWADIVAFDEAQYLKAMGSIRSQAAHKLIFENSIERCLFLTGTPIENRVYEFYSMMAMCQYDPRIEDSEFLKRFPTYVHFANYFSYLEEFDMRIKNKKGQTKIVKVQQWKGFRNVPELKDYLRPNYIRYLLSDAVDLPPSIHIPVQVSYKNSPELEKAFAQFEKDGELNSVSSDVKAKAALATAPYTVEYVQDLLDQDIKVVVFSDHPIAAQYIAEKLGVEAITGDMEMIDRQAMADAFQAGLGQVIVATSGSFSTSIDLFIAQNMVFNDPSWKPSTEDQCMSRIRRIGQIGQCIYHHIFGTIQSAKIRDKVLEKRETIRAVV